MSTALVAAAAAITVTVTGVPSDKGMVRITVCQEANWLTPDCPYSGSAPAQRGTTVVTVKDVPPGRYGLYGYADENNNDKTDRNFLGIPTERIGFSNNALKKLAKPKFDDAAILHEDAPQAATFRLRSVP